MAESVRPARERSRVAIGLGRQKCTGRPQRGKVASERLDMTGYARPSAFVYRFVIANDHARPPPKPLCNGSVALSCVSGVLAPRPYRRTYPLLTASTAVSSAGRYGAQKPLSTPFSVSSSATGLPSVASGGRRVPFRALCHESGGRGACRVRPLPVPRSGWPPLTKRFLMISPR